jgi:hypothetical protein
MLISMMLSELTEDVREFRVARKPKGVPPQRARQAQRNGEKRLFPKDSGLVASRRHREALSAQLPFFVKF